MDLTQPRAEGVEIPVSRSDLSGASFNRVLLEQVIEWDVRNWSGCLVYWYPWLESGGQNRGRVLVLGDPAGCLSLWFALLGFEVLCTDYIRPRDRAWRLHGRWRVADRVEYSAVNAFSIPYPDNQFDVVACKSVIGGLKREYKNPATRTWENQRLAVNEVRRVLKPGGVFLGAENLTATPAHMALRRLRTRGRLGWRYLSVSEIKSMFSDFSRCEQMPFGFIGTNFPKSEAVNIAAAFLDRCLSKTLPARWLYVSFIRARK